MNPLTHSKNATILAVLIALTLGCFGLLPQARAVCQEGCLTSENTVLGDDALLNNTGFDNTAIGFDALLSNTSGNSNTATGDLALFSNTIGGFNAAIGDFALYSNTTGYFNTATGGDALFNNTTGNYNTAVGLQALSSNTTGNNNTANGDVSLFHNTTGSFNTATGDGALVNNGTGSFNIALGADAGGNLTAGSNNIDIANRGVAGEANTIRIGTEGTHTATYIAGIRQAPLVHGAAVAVGITPDGQLGVRASSARFKEAINPMDKASETILALKPVTFRYKRDLDPDGVPQFGLVAEEVEKVNPDLVARDEQGKPYTVRYEAVNAMLLNEFLKEHRTVEEQGATISRQRKDFEAAIARQQKEIEALTATVKEQSAQIQKVSAQLEARKPAPQVVKNP